MKSLLVPDKNLEPQEVTDVKYGRMQKKISIQLDCGSLVHA